MMKKIQEIKLDLKLENYFHIEDVNVFQDLYMNKNSLLIFKNFSMTNLDRILSINFR
jgi:hypothetical protein